MRRSGAAPLTTYAKAPRAMTAPRPFHDICGDLRQMTVEDPAHPDYSEWMTYSAMCPANCWAAPPWLLQSSATSPRYITENAVQDYQSRLNLFILMKRRLHDALLERAAFIRIHAPLSNP